MDALHAYHGDPTTKECALARVRADRFAGRILQRVYWQHGGRNEALVSTLHEGYSASSESELGIPAMLASLAHTIFDGLPGQDATMFPEAFLTAIPVGADLSLVAARFHRWLLADAQ